MSHIIYSNKVIKKILLKKKTLVLLRKKYSKMSIIESKKTKTTLTLIVKILISILNND